MGGVDPERVSQMYNGQGERVDEAMNPIRTPMKRRVVGWIYFNGPVVSLATLAVCLFILALLLRGTNAPPVDVDIPDAVLPPLAYADGCRDDPDTLTDECDLSAQETGEEMFCDQYPDTANCVELTPIPTRAPEERAVVDPTPTPAPDPTPTAEPTVESPNAVVNQTQDGKQTVELGDTDNKQIIIQQMIIQADGSVVDPNAPLAEDSGTFNAEQNVGIGATPQTAPVIFLSPTPTPGGNGNGRVINGEFVEDRPSG